MNTSAYVDEQRSDPDQTARLRRLIWSVTVCLEKNTSYLLGGPVELLKSEPLQQTLESFLFQMFGFTFLAMLCACVKNLFHDVVHLCVRVRHCV